LAEEPSPYVIENVCPSATYVDDADDEYLLNLAKNRKIVEIFIFESIVIT